MTTSPPPERSVVVGIDGSRDAVGAALWAVDEAVSREIPLRLLYAIDPQRESDRPNEAARDLATGELAVRQALNAVEATGKPIKIEVEISQARPVEALLKASSAAAMVCLGAVGLNHAMPGGVGSTATALVLSAHCPVAIVRPPGGVASGRTGWIVAEVDEGPENAALEQGLDEARLRDAPLRVLMAWESRFSDTHDADAVASNNRAVKAQLDRRLERWRRRYPDLDVQSVPVHGSTLRYIAQNAKSIQLVVVAAQRSGGTTDFVGPSGIAALRDTECSVLVCNRQRLL